MFIPLQDKVLTLFSFHCKLAFFNFFKEQHLNSKYLSLPESLFSLNILAVNVIIICT